MAKQKGTPQINDKKIIKSQGSPKLGLRGRPNLGLLIGSQFRAPIKKEEKKIKKKVLSFLSGAPQFFFCRKNWDTIVMTVWVKIIFEE